MDLEKIKYELGGYDGPAMRIMEICGSHTEAVARFGIPSLISDKITLLSGPGCPVCVTASAYIDRLIELGKNGKRIVTFGDLIRVPGSSMSLADAGSMGVHIDMVYSPKDVLGLAAAAPGDEFVFAAVGFETTAPVYAMLIDEIVRERIKNVKLLTSLKTMPEVVMNMLDNGAPIDAFIAPGHVCVVTGYKVFEEAAKKHSIPFGVAGFGGEQIMTAIYGLTLMRGRGIVKNFYPAVVSRDGNTTAWDAVMRFFEKCDATWRGLGSIPDSGLVLRDEYLCYDAGSTGLDEDVKKNSGCRCDEVLTGRLKPGECPLFGKACSPMDPQGACMVSSEGSCHTYYVNAGCAE